MLDAQVLTPLPTAPRPARHQRSHGRARVALEGGRIVALAQAGSAKAMLHLPPATEAPQVVFLNTSGGLTAGDRLAFALDLAAGRATATTQTAERAYRAEGGRAAVEVTLSAGPGARLDWLPQETILFDGAALDRHTRVDLAPDARFLGIETIVLGRAAMGETVATLSLTDQREIRRGGAPLLIDPLRLDSAALARAGQPALLAGARAFATLILAAPGAEDALAPVRAALTEPGVTAAATGWDGRLILRAHAPDAWPLRHQLARIVALLRPEPLPRCWQFTPERAA